MTPRLTLAAALLVLAGSAHAESPERLAVFDLGSLDTLDALALESRVAGVPKQTLPDYLAAFEDDTYADIGGLRSPDLEALATLDPSLIVITGRQGDWREEFAALADVEDTSLTGDDYLAAVDANARRLAERLEADAEPALTALHAHVEAARHALDGAPAVLVATHNGGNLMLNAHPVVHQVLGLAQPSGAAELPGEARGERVFTPLSPDTVAELAPAALLIVDRSAAIGDAPLVTAELEAALAAAGAESTRVVVLSPALWYLSGGGLQSLRLQVDEVVAALSQD
ncbi:ABC transporter substrate-binding protein [Halomonas salifodinae]|uniref:ABC transporter substrate-binding protein n=1 Tax=Halomonas salifodinae TaxID=438745 RepID=UPI00339FA899